jgi:hypothetical protein
MLSAHIASFLKLISAQLEETSRGIRSIHHFHNVQCGIANILSLLENNNDVVEKADQLSRRASSYICFRRSAAYVDKIFNGVASSDLPAWPMSESVTERTYQPLRSVGEVCHRMRRPRTTRTAPYYRLSLNAEAEGGANGHAGFAQPLRAARRCLQQSRPSLTPPGPSDCPRRHPSLVPAPPASASVIQGDGIRNR